MSKVVPPPPKKALSPFFLYRKQVYESTKAEHPNAKITELTKIIADHWNNESKETKQRLSREYEANKIEQSKIEKEYIKKYGSEMVKKKVKRSSRK